ncbi:DUF975 family protein [Exiguobacterium aquaticum]|uniref:DUF975 family protein n=1 Tax=Exiguobacterium TaxID=33986 RepID=UPI001BE51686|nr:MULTISPECIES: DUF975 family protein [Exiguobacterium]MCT4777697.1 DUF975 family protein [Exiguobacterium aquaticum]
MVQTWNERAYEALKGKNLTLLGWSFVCAFILEAGTIVDPTLYGMTTDTLFASGIWLIGSAVVSFMLYPIIIGYHWVLLGTVRGEESQFKHVFRPLRQRYDKHVVATIVVTVYQLLWTLLFLVPGIIKYFSYAFTFFILRDEPNLSIRESITKSRDLMRGRKGEAFKLILPFIPVYVLGLTLFFYFNTVFLAALSLFVATALIRPFIVSRFAVMYEDARHEYDEQWNRSA